MRRVVNSERSFLVKELERILKDNNIHDRDSKIREILNQLVKKMLYEIDEYSPIVGPVLPKEH